MDEILQYEKFVRDRITELREKRGISEHRLSLELGKSGSYIRSITSGATMPSVKELFNIILYFLCRHRRERYPKNNRDQAAARTQ